MSLWKQLIPLLLVVGLLVNSAPVKPDCEYKCGDGKCIPSSWICDNVKDCIDGKDESGCNYLHKCGPKEFMCRSGECIKAEEKCNKVDDCSDGSDEKDCQAMITGSTINLPSATDYEDQMKHVEVSATPVKIRARTVEKRAQCPQRNGSLYFTNNDASVFAMRVTDGLQVPQLLLDGTSSAEKDVITSLSFEHDLSEILFVSKRVPNRIRAIDNKGNVRMFASHENERFSRVAIDPVTKNVYFAENGVGIGVCDKDLSKCVLLVEAESLEIRYRDLVLTPKLGQMLWIQEDLVPVLKVAGMDGKKIRILSTFEHVHAISLDAENDDLYIAEEESVVKMNLNSLIRREFAPVRASVMVFYNCDLYYVQRGHEMLRVFTSKGEDKEILALSGSVFQFVVVPDNFKVGQSNPCDNLKCAEVCVLSDNVPAQPEAQCVCRVCEVVDIAKVESSIFGWVISIILLLLLVTLFALVVIVYFRLWPSLCERLDAILGSNAHETSNISVGFNSAEFK